MYWFAGLYNLVEVIGSEALRNGKASPHVDGG